MEMVSAGALKRLVSFLIFDTKFIIFSTKFIVYNTKFIGFSDECYQ